MERIYKSVGRDEGQGLVEYAFLLTLVALAVIIALSLFGTNLVDIFEDITEAIFG
ncbi:MAG: Flp family type IVb pilin [Nitrospinota bacterium]